MSLWTRRLLLSGPINTPSPISHQVRPQPLSSPLGCLLDVYECFVRFCEFEASGVEVLAISLQGGNARLPISLVTSLCCSIIVICC
jgi:hypothetical protein